MLPWNIAGPYFAVICKSENESWHFRKKNLLHEITSDDTKYSNREREKMMEKWQKKEGVGTKRREKEILKNTTGGNLSIICTILTCFIGNFFKYEYSFSLENIQKDRITEPS